MSASTGAPPDLAAEQDDGPLDGRLMMVKERLLEALLAAPPPAAAPGAADAGAASPCSFPPQPTTEGDGDRGPPPAPAPMDVEDGGGAASPAAAADVPATADTPSAAADDASVRSGEVPTAVQVVASMVDSALEVSDGFSGIPEGETTLNTLNFYEKNPKFYIHARVKRVKNFFTRR